MPTGRPPVQYVPGAVQNQGSAGFRGSSIYPRVELSVFDGKRSDFYAWYEAFLNGVHNQTAVPYQPWEKMIYLKSMDKGEPAKLVGAYGMNPMYYDSALQNLYEKYGDQRQLIAELNAKLRQIPPSNGSVASTRDVYDQIDTVLRMMEAASQDVNHPNVMHLVETKFPAWLLDELHQVREITPGWTVWHTRQTVERILRRIETVQAAKASDKKAEPRKATSNRDQGRREDNKPRPDRHVRGNSCGR